jgi:hypothetical protein
MVAERAAIRAFDDSMTREAVARKDVNEIISGVDMNPDRVSRHLLNHGIPGWGGRDRSQNSVKLLVFPTIQLCNRHPKPVCGPQRWSTGP